MNNYLYVEMWITFPLPMYLYASISTLGKNFLKKKKTLLDILFFAFKTI